MVRNCRADEYRRNASDCRIQAHKAVRPQDRASWLKIAAQWEDLAEAADATRQLTLIAASRARG